MEDLLRTPHAAYKILKIKQGILLLTILSFCCPNLGNAQKASIENKTIPDTIAIKKHAVIKSDRADGRFISSYGVVQEMLKNNTPKYAFNPNFSKSQMQDWQVNLREAMKALMRHPDISNLPQPKLLSTIKRDGYSVEKWEAYPLPEMAAPFLVFIPDTIKHQVPAVLCIPGSGQSKESAAGEPQLNTKYGSSTPNERWTQAIPYVKKGLIAVVVDNPGAGEASDLEGFTIAPNYQYDAVARPLLEMGWSYLGLSSYVDLHILNWMKAHALINKDRLIISGFSLGTEPLMVLGAMDPSIYAFIYNDFLCRTLERMIVMTEPDKNGVRPFPNTIRHLIPGFLTNFDFPDIVASLAPRPVLLTEGGLDRDFDMVKEAYKISGKPENVEMHHYEKYADKNRLVINHLPEGLNRTAYFDMVNVDGPNHDMKMKLILSWLDKILKEE